MPLPAVLSAAVSSLAATATAPAWVPTLAAAATVATAGWAAYRLYDHFRRGEPVIDINEARQIAMILYAIQMAAHYASSGYSHLVFFIALHILFELWHAQHAKHHG